MICRLVPVIRVVADILSGRLAYQVLGSWRRLDTRQRPRITR